MTTLAANLLDDYLRCTVAAQHGTEQASIPTAVPAQTQFLHAQVLQGVHAALDSVEVAQGGPVSHPSREARQQWSPNKQTPAQRDAGHGSSRPLPTPRGLFRAMRTADASALFSEQLAAEDCQAGGISKAQYLQQREQPVFAGTKADALTSEVRLLAEHAALSTKLHKLQQDMETRSYRQGLLQTLQQPSSLFKQSQRSVSHQQLQDERQQETMAGKHRGSSAVMWQPSATVNGTHDPWQTLRPGTAPASHTQSGDSGAFSNAPVCSNGVIHGYHAQGSYPQQQQQHSLPAAGTGYDASAGGRLAATAPPQLQHLKHLADLELPWRPAAAEGAPRNQSSSPGPSRSTTEQQLLLQQRQLGTGTHSRSTSQTAARQQQLLAMAAQHQASAVPRPASAVAALQQSLSELAKLKAKYAQQQQQWQQQQMDWQQQQQQRPWHQPQVQECQGRADGTWLQADAEGQQRHTYSVGAGGAHITSDSTHSRPAAAAVASDRAYAWADMDTACGGAAMSPSGVHQGRQQRPANACSTRAHNYAVWDAWQEQVHADQQPLGSRAARGWGAPPAGAAAAQSLRGDHAWQSALRRSQSAPRMQRAWDAVAAEPCPRSWQPGLAAGGAGAFGFLHRSRSPGAGRVYHRLSASLENDSWRQQQQQQRKAQELAWDLQRPRTAAARFAHTAAAAAGATFVREADGTVELSAVRRQAAGAAGSACASAGNRTASLSGWLSSSPLKRTAQMALAHHSTATRSNGQPSAAAVRAAAAAAGLRNGPSGFGRVPAGAGTAAASAGRAAYSSWLPSTSASSSQQLYTSGVQLQRQVGRMANGAASASGGERASSLAGTSIPTRLWSVTAAASGGPATSPGAGVRAPAGFPTAARVPASMTRVPSSTMAAVGPCKAALLASRPLGSQQARAADAAARAGTAAGAAAAARGGSDGGRADGRLALVQRALYGYKLQQVRKAGYGGTASASCRAQQAGTTNGQQCRPIQHHVTNNCYALSEML